MIALPATLLAVILTTQVQLYIEFCIKHLWFCFRASYQLLKNQSLQVQTPRISSPWAWFRNRVTTEEQLTGKLIGLSLRESWFWSKWLRIYQQRSHNVKQEKIRSLKGPRALPTPQHSPGSSPRLPSSSLKLPRIWLSSASLLKEKWFKNKFKIK